MPLETCAKELTDRILEKTNPEIKKVEIKKAITTYQTQIPNTKIDGVKNVIAVASEKVE